MSSIYDKENWVLKYNDDGVQDTHTISIPSFTIDGFEDKRVPQTLCIWADFILDDGSKKGIALWLKSSQREARGDELFVSKQLLREKNISLTARNFYPRSDNPDENTNEQKVHVWNRSSLRYWISWMCKTRTGKLETLKLVVAIAATGILACIRLKTSPSNTAEIVEYLFIALGVLVSIQFCISFIQKLGTVP